MNPITAIKLYRAANKLLGVFQRATAEERAHPMSKSIFQSKIFWVNALTAAAELIQVLSGAQVVPAGYLAIAASVVNIGLRFVTAEPVHLIDPNP